MKLECVRLIAGKKRTTDGYNERCDWKHGAYKIFIKINY